MILAERLTCGYQDKIILKDVSISLAQGSFTTLLGPNGAGKSTLLYALMGFLKLKSGRIAI
ncbi:MAG TPA: ABC transporter ATP-binding protein, partial [Candidatus Cloacimonadota bacterium]|nr:ABC transporter ATP-binding protein [Candidatus Cloacimonadota bacterium]